MSYKNCMSVFLAALFVIAKNWKQLWNIYITKYYWAIKKTIDACNNLDDFTKNNAEAKKPILIGFILYDIIYITF